MCIGMGFIVTETHIYHTAPDSRGNVSHESILCLMIERRILERPETTDNIFLRKFVRVEYPTWEIESFTIDEPDTLPPWVDIEEIRARCDKLFLRHETARIEREAKLAKATDDCNRRLRRCGELINRAWNRFLEDKISMTHYCQKERALGEIKKKTTHACYERAVAVGRQYFDQLRKIPDFLY